MREKVLVIDSCLDCKHFSGFIWKCLKLNKVLDSDIDAKIPEDCPLEDKE